MILAGLWKILLTNQSSDIQIINTPAGPLADSHYDTKHKNNETFLDYAHVTIES